MTTEDGDLANPDDTNAQSSSQAKEALHDDTHDAKAHKSHGTSGGLLKPKDIEIPKFSGAEEESLDMWLLLCKKGLRALGLYREEWFDETYEDPKADLEDTDRIAEANVADAAFVKMVRWLETPVVRRIWPDVATEDTATPAHLIKSLRENYSLHDDEVTKEAKRSALARLIYQGGDLVQYIAKFESVPLEAVRAGENVNSTRKTTLLLNSIQDEGLRPVKDALRNRPSAERSYGVVKARLLSTWREWHAAKPQAQIMAITHGTKPNVASTSSNKPAANSSSAAPPNAARKCDLCGKRRHAIAECWENPRNKANKLGFWISPSGEVLEQESGKQRTAASTKGEESIHSILLDSGATRTMLPSARYVRKFNPLDLQATVANESVLPIVGKSATTLTNAQGGLDLGEALVAPDLSQPVVSVSQVTSANKSPTIVVLGGSGGLVMDEAEMCERKNGRVALEGNIIATAKQKQGLYLLDGKLSKAKINHIGTPHQPMELDQASEPMDVDEGTVDSGVIEDVHMETEDEREDATESKEDQAEANKWHIRLGHPSETVMYKLKKAGVIPAFKVGPCRVCRTANMKRKSFNQHFAPLPNGATRIHLDLVGPMDVVGVGGKKYVLSVMTEASRYAWSIPLRRKGEVSQEAISIIKGLERRHGPTVWEIRLDRAGEHLPLVRWSLRHGIRVRWNPSYHSSSNGFIERLNQTLMSKARALLCQSGIGRNYWPYAIVEATRLYNQLPHSAISDTPRIAEGFDVGIELTDHNRPFGCRAVVRDERHMKKTQNRALDGVCIGNVGHRSHLILTTGGQIIESHHCEFFEDEFPLYRDAFADSVFDKHLAKTEPVFQRDEDITRTTPSAEAIAEDEEDLRELEREHPEILADGDITMADDAQVSWMTPTPPQPPTNPSLEQADEEDMSRVSQDSQPEVAIRELVESTVESTNLDRTVPTSYVEKPSRVSDHSPLPETQNDSELREPDQEVRKVAEQKAQPEPAQDIQGGTRLSGMKDAVIEAPNARRSIRSGRATVEDLRKGILQEEIMERVKGNRILWYSDTTKPLATNSKKSSRRRRGAAQREVVSERAQAPVLEGQVTQPIPEGRDQVPSVEPRDNLPGDHKSPSEPNQVSGEVQPKENTTTQETSVPVVDEQPETPSAPIGGGSSKPDLIELVRQARSNGANKTREPKGGAVFEATRAAVRGLVERGRIQRSIQPTRHERLAALVRKAQQNRRWRELDTKGNIKAKISHGNRPLSAEGDTEGRVEDEEMAKSPLDEVKDAGEDNARAEDQTRVAGQFAPTPGMPLEEYSHAQKPSDPEPSLPASRKRSPISNIRRRGERLRDINWEDLEGRFTSKRQRIMQIRITRERPSRKLTPEPEDPSAEFDPKSVHDALRSRFAAEWQEAMLLEESAMRGLRVWKEIPRSELPEGVKTVKTRWILTTKRDQFNRVLRRKARLIAQGFAFEARSATYSPLCGWDAYLATLSVASELGLRRKTEDVSTAYLYAPVKEPIYLEPPVGHPAAKENRVFELRRSLYGISSSGRNFYDFLKSNLEKQGWRASKSDGGLFYRARGGQVQLLTSYVDDLSYFARTDEELQEIAKELRSFMKLKASDGEDYLAVRTIEDWKHDRPSFRLHQKGHIDALVRDEGLSQATPIYTVSEVMLDREEDDGEPLGDDAQSRFRSLVGSLAFLANRTRPDIAFSVSRLAAYTGRATKFALEAARRVIRYLKSTRDLELHIRGNPNTTPADPKLAITAYTDASFAPGHKDRRSQTGLLVQVNGNPVTWASRKQKVAVSSTSSSEYIAAHDAALEGRHIADLVREVTGMDVPPLELLVDNQSAITWVDGTSSKGTRYVDIRYHLVRDLAIDGALEAHYCPTQDQLADGLTKTLSRQSLREMVKGIGLLSP